MSDKKEKEGLKEKIYYKNEYSKKNKLIQKKQKQKWDDIVKPNKMQKGQIGLD